MGDYYFEGEVVSCSIFLYVCFWAVEGMERWFGGEVL